MSEETKPLTPFHAVVILLLGLVVLGDLGLLMQMMKSL